MKNLYYILLLFPILGENVISTLLGDSISKLLSVLSCAIMLLLVLRNKIRLNWFLIDMLLLILLRVVIVFAGSGIKITVANNMITPYGLIGYFMLFLLLEVIMSDRNKLITIFKSMAIIMTISVFMNFFFTSDMHIANNAAVFREAVTTGYTNSRKWLFGHRNAIFVHHMMWMTFSYIWYRLEGRDYFKLFLFQSAFTFLVAIVSWNSTMLITTMIVIGLGVFRNNIFARLTIMHYVLAYTFLEIGIVFVRIQQIFSYLVVNILHRNLSFTGRTRIWDYYINQFKKGSVIQKLIGNLGKTDLVTNSHNMFLGLLVFTGLAGVILYFFLLYLCAKELLRHKNEDFSRFISIIIFAFLVNSLAMEFYLQPMIVMYMGYRFGNIGMSKIEEKKY